MCQQMAEEEILQANGEKAITVKLERGLCGMSASISQMAIMFHLFDIFTTTESVTELAVRKRCVPASIELSSTYDERNRCVEPSLKRMKCENDVELKPLKNEVEYLARRLSVTWDRE